MSEFDEKTITALTTLFETVAALQKIKIRDMLRPEIYLHYEQTLQAAYNALTQVEDAISSLGMRLEYQHWRLGGAVEELKPLLIQSHTKANELTALLESDRFSK
jgi:spore cortex formation protein SpoVR/YcgB (stage V sporulation)